MQASSSDGFLPCSHARYRWVESVILIKLPDDNG